MKEHLGIIYESHNHYQLETRLEELAKSEGYKSLEDLYTYTLKNGMFGRFKQKLLDLATNNETSFFRDPKIFQHIENVVIPELAKKSNSIRVWSAASSNGQEIYSFLMLLEDMKLPSKPAIKEFIATDISDRALKKAEEGIYTKLEVGRGLTPEHLQKHFDAKADGNYQVKPTLRKNVKFMSQNILAPFTHLGKFDIILCRNILIYQEVKSKKQIIERLYDQLTDNGVLIMGVGESMIGLTDKFEQFSYDAVSIYKKSTKLKKVG
ncbi:MAG: CheR family methyltransferase [Pseudobdellovibrio sp.]